MEQKLLREHGSGIDTAQLHCHLPLLALLCGGFDFCREEHAEASVREGEGDGDRAVDEEGEGSDEDKEDEEQTAGRWAWPRPYSPLGRELVDILLRVKALCAVSTSFFDAMLGLWDEEVKAATERQ